MRHFRWVLICGTLITLVLFGGVASAHGTEPLKTLKVRIGQYPMIVNYYTDPRGGQALVFSLEPEITPSGPLRYEVTAIPGTTVDAVPVKAALAPDPDHPNGVQGTVNLPVSGQWLLNVVIVGPYGTTYDDVPVLAAAPPALPEWVGWMIGLIPVWAILGLIIALARNAVRAQPSGQPAGI